MAIYWFLLLVPALGSLNAAGQKRPLPEKIFFEQTSKDKPSLNVYFFALLLILLVGFRHEVGGDWIHYLAPVKRAANQTWLEATMSGGDPAYGLLTWVSAQLGGGVYLVNLVCAAIFAWGLLVFARNSPTVWLTICVAVPYLVIVVAMGYTRQGVAIGLIMVGLVAFHQGSIYRFAAWVLFAALFHKSALILLPLAVFSGRKNWGAVLGVMIVGSIMFALLLAEYVDSLLAGYITNEYASSGAGIRVAMNALPGAVFLVFRNRFGLTPAQQSFWVWMSIGALAFIGILAASPSSTAVDRVALYWIPLQLFVWSRLPIAMGKRKETQVQWLIVILAYSFAVQFVWLFYAEHSSAWLPYKFYPWGWLWK